MATPNYTNLITALIEATKAKKLVWNRERINRLLFSSTDPNKYKILLEQYYAEVDDLDEPCINMSIFNDNEEIINEIVLCESSDLLDDYKLLRDLYWKVDEVVSDVENEKSAPVINDITESIQRMVTR